MSVLGVDVAAPADERSGRTPLLSPLFLSPERSGAGGPALALSMDPFLLDEPSSSSAHRWPAFPSIIGTGASVSTGQPGQPFERRWTLDPPTQHSAHPFDSQPYPGLHDLLGYDPFNNHTVKTETQREEERTERGEARDSPPSLTDIDIPALGAAKPAPAGGTSARTSSSTPRVAPLSPCSSEASSPNLGPRPSSTDPDAALTEDGKKRKLNRLSPDQVSYLKQQFDECSKLNQARRNQLASVLGLQPRQVEVWFQNKRAKIRVKDTEKDLQEAKQTLAENEKQLQELRKANKELQSQVKSLQSQLQSFQSQGSSSAGSGSGSKPSSSASPAAPASVLPSLQSLPNLPSPPPNVTSGMALNVRDEDELLVGKSDGSVCRMAPSLSSALGYSEEEARALTLATITFPSDAAACQGLQLLLSRLVLSMEMPMRLRTRRGEEVPCHARLSAHAMATTGGEVYLVAYIRRPRDPSPGPGPAPSPSGPSPSNPSTPATASAPAPAAAPALPSASGLASLGASSPPHGGPAASGTPTGAARGGGSAFVSATTPPPPVPVEARSALASLA
eukprot:tig00000789_g4096.t1